MRDEKQAKCAGEIEKYECEIREKVALSKSIFDNVCELDRVVKLSEINPQEFEETNNFLPLISKRNEKLKTLIDLFKMSLEKEIKDRDLSKEKIKNPSILGIKLPRFKGYGSVMDFYTFKVEFEKLVAPWVQAKLLPEYLKKYYLEGQAFQIVKEIDDIDKIWGRLKRLFGNVVTLSTKLKEIESGVPLWQIKSEKLVQAITKIKNCMMDLSGLAAKHKIEASLFHHSNLAKIYSILGRKRQTDIMRKLVEFNYSEQETWEEIINFRKRNSSKRAREKDRNQTYVNQSKCKKFIICEKNDHVPTITRKGNLIVNYFACDKFAKMSPKERFEKLKETYAFNV